MTVKILSKVAKDVAQKLCDDKITVAAALTVFTGLQEIFDSEEQMTALNFAFQVGLESAVTPEIEELQKKIEVNNQCIACLENELKEMEQLLPDCDTCMHNVEHKGDCNLFFFCDKCSQMNNHTDRPVTVKSCNSCSQTPGYDNLTCRQCTKYSKWTVKIVKKCFNCQYQSITTNPDEEHCLCNIPCINENQFIPRIVEAQPQ